MDTLLKILPGIALLILTGCFSDIIVTQEPDAFFSARPFRTGQMDVGLRMMHLGWLPTERALYGASVTCGLSPDWELRAGWALAGTHWRQEDPKHLFLNALELRGRRQLLADGPFRLAAGAGCDLFFADPAENGRLEYYGLRPMLQTAAGVYTRPGFGMFVPFAVNVTFLRPEQTFGWSITPGLGVALEHDYFFARAAANVPFGRFLKTESALARMMAPSAGFELGGRIPLLR